MIDTMDMNYNQLTKSDNSNIHLPLFSQFFEYIRSSHRTSIESLAQKLGVEPKYIIGLENGKIWGNVNQIDLNKMEYLYNLKKGCLKRYLKQTLVV